MEEDEKLKVLEQFFDETPGAFGRANYLTVSKSLDVNKPKHNFESNTISRIIPMKINETKLLNWLKTSYFEIFTSTNENNYNYKKSKYTADVLVSILIFDKIFDEDIWSKVYRRRIHFYLEEIVEINNKDLENYGNLYLNIINKFRKFINKKYTEEEMEAELEDKSLEGLKRELIDRNLNKFLKEEHSKMIKKLIEEDEIFKNDIEG
uniref:Uncharacterized protein n=1 Tax=Meloidogyne enterolobii TaxID=390850 RepID=A0A6V7TI65_MELEN|nr:unnamed protein product [Meloidogyne enterolobii]